MTDDFDLRDVLANRAYPTTTVRVWIDEESFFELDKLQHKAAGITDKKALADVEQKIQNVIDNLNATALKVHLRGTSRRAREDMVTESLVQFPIKRDVMGREDDLQTYKRGNYLTELYFAAHIQKIEYPNGKIQELDEENRRGVAYAFVGEMPDFSVKIVDEAIGALRGEAEMQQGVDFLSRT